MVILASDNDQVLAVAERLDANIVVRVAGVPDEGVGNRTFRHGPGDRVSAVRNLFGVDGHFIIYGGVGCEHGGARPDYKSPFRANFDAVVSLVMRDISRVLIKTSPAGNDRAGKT